MQGDDPSSMKAGVGSSCSVPSQLAPGLPGVWNGFGDMDDNFHQQEGLEDVVILDKKDCPVEVKGAEVVLALGPSRAGFGHPGGKPNKRMSAASRMSRSDEPRFCTYDELIEGDSGGAEVAFHDDLDFQVEVPQEIEEIEV